MSVGPIESVFSSSTKKPTVWILQVDVFMKKQLDVPVATKYWLGTYRRIVISGNETDMKRFICLGLTLAVFGGCCNSGCKPSLLDWLRAPKFVSQRNCQESQCGCNHCADSGSNGVCFAEVSSDCGCDVTINAPEIASTVLSDRYADRGHIEIPARPPLETTISSRYKPNVASEFVAPKIHEPKLDESEFLNTAKLNKSEPEEVVDSVIENEVDRQLESELEETVPFIPLKARPLKIIPISSKKEVPSPVILDEVTPEPYGQFDAFIEPDVDLPAAVEITPLGPVVLKARPVQNHRVNDARVREAKNRISTRNINDVDRFGLPSNGPIHFQELPEIGSDQSETPYYDVIKSGLETSESRLNFPLFVPPEAVKPTLVPNPKAQPQSDSFTSKIKHHTLIEVPAKTTPLKAIEKPLEIMRLSARTELDPKAGKAVANFKMTSPIIRRTMNADTGSLNWDRTEVASETLHSRVPMLKASAKLITIDR